MSDTEVTYEAVPIKHPGTYSDWKPEQKAAFDAHWEHIDTLHSGSGYDWAQLDVWRRKSDGKLVWDEDAGCSCNGPYDDATGRADLPEIDTYATFRDTAMKWATDGYEGPSAEEVQKFLNTVRKAMG